MKVWIDQDLCTGVASCADVAPAVFAMGSDGLAYVVEAGQMQPGDASVVVPAGMEDAVIEAAEGCPAECIYIDIVT